LSFCNGTKGSKTDSYSSLAVAKTLTWDRESILKTLKPLLETLVFWLEVSSEEE